MSEPTVSPALDSRLRALLPEDGPTYKEVQEQQRPLNRLWENVGEPAKEIADAYFNHKIGEKALEMACHAVEHTFGAANAAKKLSMVGTALLTFQAAWEGTKLAYDLSVTKPMNEGKERSDGLERDLKNLALLMIVRIASPDTIPDGYYSNQVSEVLGTDGKATLNQKQCFNTAGTFLGKAVTDPELARSRDIFVAAMREGVTAAYQWGIDSKAGLEKLKTTDTVFRSRYESDPLFRLGIQSVIWQATYHRDEYDAALSMRTGYRGTTTRM